VGYSSFRINGEFPDPVPDVMRKGVEGGKRMMDIFSFLLQDYTAPKFLPVNNKAPYFLPNGLMEAAK